MSSNINQIPTAATTILASDKMYLGRSPFDATDDRYILGSSIIAQLAPLTTKGDLYTFSTVNARLAVGTVDGQILQVSSVAATGLAWSTPTYPSASGTSGQVVQSNGTNNVYSTATYPITTTINRLLYSSANNTVVDLATVDSASLATSAAGVPTWLGPLTNGQIVIGSTGLIPVATTITPGAGISISNTAGAITITASGSGAFAWTVVTSATQTMASNNGYIANRGTLVTLTLPATANVGDEVDIMGQGAGGWLIAQPAGVTIRFGTSSTTTGVGGSLASTQQRDVVFMICTTANTEWTVYTSIGNLTVV